MMDTDLAEYPVVVVACTVDACDFSGAEIDRVNVVFMARIQVYEGLSLRLCTSVKVDARDEVKRWHTSLQGRLAAIQ